MTEREKSEKGMLYDANSDQEILDLRRDCKDMCHKFNHTMPSDTAILAVLFIAIITW